MKSNTRWGASPSPRRRLFTLLVITSDLIPCRWLDMFCASRTKARAVSIFRGPARLARRLMLFHAYFEKISNHPSSGWTRVVASLSWRLLRKHARLRLHGTPAAATSRLLRGRRSPCQFGVRKPPQHHAEIAPSSRAAPFAWTRRRGDASRRAPVLHQGTGSVR